MGYAPDSGVMSAMIITFSIATLLVVCRLISRRMTNVALWWDDYFAMLAWVGVAPVVVRRLNVFLYPLMLSPLIVVLIRSLLLCIVGLHYTVSL